MSPAIVAIVGQVVGYVITQLKSHGASVHDVEAAVAAALRKEQDKLTAAIATEVLAELARRAGAVVETWNAAEDRGAAAGRAIRDSYQDPDKPAPDD